LSNDELLLVEAIFLGGGVHPTFVVIDLSESANHGDGLFDCAALKFAWDEVLPYFESQVDFYFPHNVILIMRAG